MSLKLYYIVSVNRNKGFLKALQKTGLNNEESLICNALIKYGRKGAIVKELNSELSIERTTIYSILRRLIAKAYVIEGDPSDSSQKIKKFIAVEPSKLYNEILSNKREALREFEKTKIFFKYKLENIYKWGGALTYDDLDANFKPYLKTLLEKTDKDWKILSQVIEKGSNTFGYDFYKYEIQSFHYMLRMNSGFNAYVFDYSIENDENALIFFINHLKKIVPENILKIFPFEDLNARNGEINLFGKIYHSLIFEVKLKNKQKVISPIKTAIISLENKIFFIWAYRKRVIQEIVASILSVKS